MNQTQLHPNTQTLLSAWKRMTGKANSANASPQSDEHPDLVAALFVIEQNEDGMWLFRNAGHDVHTRLGRDPADHNFLEMWRGYDRIITGSIINAVVENAAPAVLQAHGETLTGFHTKVEITLASLSNVNKKFANQRLIGLYQSLDLPLRSTVQPVWQHRLQAIFPPQTETQFSHLRLVASND